MLCCAVLVSEIDGWFLKAAGKIGEDKRTWCVCVWRVVVAVWLAAARPERV